MWIGNLKNRISQKSGPWILIALALGTSGLFKIAAFAREAFIASKFGLSTVTDAYFGLQQLPLIVATYMFGAFSLAYAPAFAEARREQDEVNWLPGLTAVGLLIGLLCTLLMLATTPLLLHLIHIDPTPGVLSTLHILSLCFIPIILIGLWAGICTARGQNLWAMSMTGFPYLVMVLWLFGQYAIGKLGNLSLPESMTAGFCLVGIYSLVRLYLLQAGTYTWQNVRVLLRIQRFRVFLRQLAASSIENVGYAANQLAVLYFLSRSGTGEISGNNCAMRIGMLGFNLLAMPMAQLVQAKLCGTEQQERPRLFRNWFFLVAGFTLIFSLLVFVLRFEIIRLVYMHGKFQDAALSIVASLLPAWIAYIAVMSMNALVSRYLFIQNQGSIYVRRQLMAYAVANLLRFFFATSMSGAFVIWCSAGAEFCAMLLNLHSCMKDNGMALGYGELAAESEVAG